MQENIFSACLRQMAEGKAETEAQPKKTHLIDMQERCLLVKRSTTEAEQNQNRWIQKQNQNHERQSEYVTVQIIFFTLKLDNEIRAF